MTPPDTSSGASCPPAGRSLRRQLPELASGEGLLEEAFARHEPARDPVPPG